MEDDSLEGNCKEIGKCEGDRVDDTAEWEKLWAVPFVYYLHAN